MNNQTIQMPEVTMPNTPDFNDRDIANEILSTEKQLATGYTTFITEASNDFLYKRINSLQQDAVQSHRNFYNLMFQKGWYKVDLEEKQAIESTFSQFKNYKSQIN